MLPEIERRETSEQSKMQQRAETSTIPESSSGPDQSPAGSGRSRLLSAFWTLLDQAFLSGVSLLVALAVGRELGDSGLGLYYVGFPVLVMLVTVLSSTISIPYAIRLQAMTGERRATWFGSALVAQGLLLALLVTLLLATAGYLWLTRGADPAWLCVSIAAAGSGQWLREFVRRLFLADFRSATATFIDGTTAALQIAAIWYLIREEQLTVPRAFFSIALAHTVGAIVGTLLLRLPVRISREQVRADIRNGWSFGRRILGASMISVVQGWSIPWIVPIVGSLAISGRFTESLTIPLLINPLSMGLAAFLPPLYARIRNRDGVRGLRNSVVQHTCVLAVLLLILIIAVAFKGVYFLELAYAHPAASNAWWTLMLLTLSHGIPRLLLLPLEHSIIAAERSDIVLRTSTVAMLSTLLGVAIATPVLAELGTAIAIFFAMLFSESIKVYLGWKALSASPVAASLSAGQTLESSSPQTEAHSSLTRSPESRTRRTLSVTSVEVQEPAARESVPASLPRQARFAPRIERDEREDRALQDAIERGRQQRLNLLAICIWVAVLATFSPPGRDEAITVGSLDVVAKLKLVCRLGMMALISFMVLDRQSWRLNGWLQSIFLPMVAYLAWSGASVSWSAIPSVSLGQLVSFSLAVAFAYLTACNVREEKDVSKLLMHLTLSCSFVCLVLTGAHFLVPSIGKFSRGMETGFMHPTAIASTAAVAYLVTLISAVVFRWNWALKSALPLLALQLLTLFVAENRMSVAMLAPTTLALLLIYASRRQLFIGAGFACIALFAYLMADPGLSLFDAVLGETNSFASRGQTSDEVGSFSGRFEMWAAQLESLSQSPWLGHGYFITSADGQMYVWFTLANWTAHNIWLQVAVTTGLIGLAIFTWTILSWLLVSWKAHRQTPIHRSLVPAMGWIGFWFLGWSAINESISGPFQPESVAFFLFFGLGLAGAAPKISESIDRVEPISELEKQRLQLLSGGRMAQASLQVTDPSVAHYVGPQS